jgi:surfactin synthase thioesterase subunit
MRTPWLSGSPAWADAPLRLFCFAHAGGGAAFYWPWRAALQPEIGVCSVVLPGRESRQHDEPYTSMSELIGPLSQALVPYTDRPFAFFGHSLGSIVAYEAARRLTEGWGRQPCCLMVSGRRAPHLAARRPPLHRLVDGQFLAGVAAFGGTPPEVLRDRGVVELLIKSLRADFELNETYGWLAGPGLSCPVSAFMGDDDIEVSRWEMAAWQEVTTGPFTLRTFAGGHFYLKGPCGPLLAAVRHDLTPWMSGESARTDVR